MTRAIIKVEGLENVCLVRMNDGNDGGFKTFLSKFNTQYEQKRKNDPNYKMAQLIRATVMIDKDPVFNWAVYSNDKVSVDYTHILKSDGTVLTEKNDNNYSL